MPQNLQIPKKSTIRTHSSLNFPVNSKSTLSTKLKSSLNIRYNIEEQKMENNQDQIIRLISFTTSVYKYIKDSDNQKFISKKFSDVQEKLAQKGKTFPDNQISNIQLVRELSGKYNIETKNLPQSKDSPQEKLVGKLLGEVGEKSSAKTPPPPKTSSPRKLRTEMKLAPSFTIPPFTPKREQPTRRESYKIPSSKLTPEFMVPGKVKPVRPVPKPRTRLPPQPKERPIPKPRTRIPPQLIQEEPPQLIQEEPPKLLPNTRFVKELEDIVEPFSTGKRPTYKKTSHSFSNLIKRYKIQIVSNDPHIQLSSSLPSLVEILTKNLIIMGGVKYHINLDVEFIKPKGWEGYELADYGANHVAITLLQGGNIEESLEEAIALVQQRVDGFIARGSGWSIAQLKSMNIVVNTYAPLEGSSYLDLPKSLQKPQLGLRNIFNKDDNECFRWSHVRFLRPMTRDPKRITKEDKEVANSLNYDGITFPVSIDQIPRIESQNNLNINVIGHKSGKTFYPIHVSKSTFKDTMTLLLITSDECNHYVLVKDFNNLLHSYTKDNHKKHFCISCFQNFRSEEHLHKHLKDCLVINGKQAIRMPVEGTTVDFKNHKNQLFAPFVIYSDFECILSPVEYKSGNHTKVIQRHKVVKYGYKRICKENEHLSGEYKTYTGEDACKKFVSTIRAEQKECNKLAKQFFNQKGEMDEDSIAHFRQQKSCYICSKDLSTTNKVAYFHRINSNYLGAIHKSCQTKFFKIPVVFHNLRGYDSHPIILESCEQKIDLTVIATNLQKYLSFSFGNQLVFIDSLQFMSTSLEKLVSNLKGQASDEELALKFPITSKRFQGESLKLMTQKGVFPYDHFTSLETTKETQLPSKDAFFSTLYDTPVSDKDYQRAQTVWSHFNMSSFNDYLNLYQETDVLLLADVFENFRSTCHATYKLDPANYISNPSLTWDAMLKDKMERGGAAIELLSDIEMHNFFEKGTRGGVAQISHKFAKTNNKFKSNFNPKEKSTFCKYWDVNNLYGGCMSQPLPYGNFKWEDPDIIDYKQFLEDSHRGAVLEVDLDYPKELHNLHADLPLAPHKMLITEDMISPYNKKIRSQNNLSPSEEDCVVLGKLHDCWDNSNYDKDSPYFSNKNKKVPGKMKDEMGGQQIEEISANKPKSYAILKSSGKEEKKLKGIPRCAKDRVISYADVKDCIFKGTTKRITCHTIRSVNHNLRTISQDKLALSNYDTKRYVLDDGITSLPYGHYKIQ
ncbi:Hypothetical predicted protein [Paramuricea clavata]|uniref:Uncharacterized protein n=1 Tax=Paramuricea clavata TaxID=317549 RepID=A0A7D9DQ41_PARCT|nr:Hypothetical predicted protein [Paramuricea clavata]